MVVIPPICIYCKHFNIENWNCPAFPKGIPSRISHSLYDHSRPYKTQKGSLVFESNGLGSGDLSAYHS